MNRELALGIVLLVGGLGGYVLGIVQPFPGRAFSITAFIVGCLLVAISRSTDEVAS